MPLNPNSNLFTRLWKFVDQFGPGDDITRTALDVALDDITSGVNAALKYGLNFVGNWDARDGEFPAARPDGGTIQPRDLWIVSYAATVDGVYFDAGDALVALVAQPSDTYAGQWARIPKDATGAMLELLAQAEDARDLAENWAQSATAPDPEDPTSKSAKTWAGEAETLHDDILAVYDGFPTTADQFRVLATVDGQTDFTVPEYPVAAPENVLVFLDSFEAPFGDCWGVPAEDLALTTSTTIRLTEGVPAGSEVSGSVKRFTTLPIATTDWSNVTGKPALVPERFAPYRMLAFADPQPLPEFVTEWRGILDEIADDSRGWDDVLFAGDLVDYGAPDGRPSYAPNAYTLNDAWADLSSRLGVTAANFMAVAGNHDNDYGGWAFNPAANRFDTWEKVVGPRCWARRRGNLLIIGLSPIGRSTTGFYAQQEVAWARDLVARHQTCNIVMMTHHPLNDTFVSADISGVIPGGINAVIHNSDAFDWVNDDDHRVELWLSGHQGNKLDDDGAIIGDPEEPQDGFVIASAYNDLRCVGLNLPPTRRDEEGEIVLASKSMCRIRVDDGATTMQIERVNVPSMTLREVYSIPLRWPSRITGPVQMDTRFDKRDDQPRWGYGFRAVEYDRVWDGSTWAPRNGVHWAYDFALTDDGNDNVSAGDGVGVRLMVPGREQYSVGDAPPLPDLSVLAYAGGGIAAVRRTGTETDRSADLWLYASFYSGGVGGLTSPLHIEYEGVKFHNQQTFFTLPEPTLDLGDPGNPPPEFLIRQHSGGQLFKVRRRDTPAPGWSGTDAVAYVSTHGTTSRSLNAGGTLNASGADYAEYFRRCDRMIGAGLFVAKGQIVGLDATGKITDLWAEAVGGWLIKSTAPNLVGNDGWGTPESLGVPEGDERALAIAAEAERPAWDRLALCGQVPTLIDATAGDVGKWLVAVQDGLGIGCALVPDSMLTFDQYRRRLGRIVTIAGGKAVALVGVM